MREAGRGVRAAGGLFALLGLSLSLLWLTGGGAAARPDGEGTVEPARTVADQVTDSDIADGRELYLLNCASCHGLEAEGLDEGPRLDDVGLAAWHFYMSTGRMPLGDPDVPAWLQRETQLAPEEIEAILAYAATFVSGPDIPTVRPDEGELRDGWALYMNNCAACHGVAGGGGVPGPAIVAPDLYGVTDRELGEAIIVGPGLMPAFDLGEEQVNSIALYVAYLRDELPTPGGLLSSVLGPVAEGFIAGVLGVTLLIVIAVWIARKPVRDPEPEASPPQRRIDGDTA